MCGQKWGSAVRGRHPTENLPCTDAEHSHWARRHSYYPSDAPFTAAAAAHHVILGSGASFAPEVLQVRGSKYVPCLLTFRLHPVSMVWHSA